MLLRKLGQILDYVPGDGIDADMFNLSSEVDALAGGWWDRNITQVLTRVIPPAY